ncbi:tetratricopeptide repeat protein [bacterium]|nr:tetratricopeptide repeat protein [candidate division CSSED10-310 bacterium]
MPALNLVYLSGMGDDANNIPKTIGPYCIINLLGRGGMGVVYLCEHMTTSKTVAVKTIRVPNSKHVETIRREIRALARISHPGVVKIIDEGIADDLPWYAMEFLEGITLRQYASEFVWGGSNYSTVFSSRALEDAIRDRVDHNLSPSSWWTQVFNPLVVADTVDDLERLPEPIKTDSSEDIPEERVPAASGSLISVLTLVNRLCRTLAFLHGEGVVHGDLKPENILIRPDGMPVLLDFGLVTQNWTELSREELSVSAISGGTLRYIAPEQLRGELIDARADLYSLGCILYELVTGQLQYAGKNITEILNAQLNIFPVLPSKRVDGVSKELDRLIMHLLAKQPHDRIGHADDVSTVLRQLGAKESDLEPMPKPRAYLYRPRFAGREDILDRFSDYLSNLNSGKGSLIMIGGESGIGKTRLLLHLAQLAKSYKIGVLTGECAYRDSYGLGNESQAPFAALKHPLQYIADYCNDKGVAETDRVLGRRGKILANYEPRLATLPGQEKYPEPQPLPAEAAQLRLYTYMLETFTALTQGKKLILLLDNLQWVDELTLGFLHFTISIRQLERIPLLVVGTYRTEEVNARTQSLLNASRINHIVLGSLDEKAINAVISDMMGVSETSTAFVRYLTKASEGNPFFVSEYLREAVASGIIYRNHQGIWHAAEMGDRYITEKDLELLPMPRVLVDLVERRLEFLSDQAMNLLSRASVIGSVVDGLSLWYLVPYCGESLDLLDELLKRQVLNEISPGQYSFAHRKLHEIAYQRLPADLRSELHETMANAIESIHADNLEGHYAALSRHWELSGHTVKAGAYYLIMARNAVSCYAFQEAESAYRSYLNLVDRPTAETIGVRIDLAKKVLFIQGRFTEALTEFTQCLEDARTINEIKLESESIREMAEMHVALGNLDEATSLCDQAVLIQRKENDLAGEAMTLSCLAQIHYFQGRLEEAKALYHKTAEIFTKLGNTEFVGKVKAEQAPICWIQGEKKKAQSLYEEALIFYAQAGDRLAVAKCKQNLAVTYKYFGEINRARELYKDALSMVVEIGDRQTEGVILSNLSSLYSNNNELETAEKLLKKALKIHREIHDRRLEGITLNHLAMVFGRKGEMEEAVRMYHESLAINREVSNTRMEAETLSSLARLKRIMENDLETAEKLVMQADTLFRQIGDQVGIAMCLLQIGHINLARGESCQSQLEQIKCIMTETDSDETSQLGKAYKILENCEDALNTDVRLFRGERLMDLSGKIRRWLDKKGYLNQI